MRSIRERSGLAIALFLITLPVVAHHSRTIFDRERVVTIEGVVTEYEWANPHVTVFVETKTDSGDAVVWAFEGGATTFQRGRGWSSDMLAPGDHVIAEGNPLRTAGATTADVISIRKAGVTVVDYGVAAAALEGGAPAPIGADGLSGIWYVPQSPSRGQFGDPSSSWSLTPKGIEALETYDDRTMNPQNECRARTAPWLMTWGVYSIEVSDRLISIRTEYDTVERTVHMDVASHDGASITNQGHSIGRWEDEVLVVDTTHFADHRTGNARGVPSGFQKHLVERFELNPDGTVQTYRFELEDLEYLSAPVTGELQSAYRPDLGFEPIKCDLEIAGRFLED
ncbi:MAG: DUF6152 family protein [Gammaproteobacteria bacterium]